MEEIIKAITDAAGLEDSAKTFQNLSKEKKRALLEALKNVKSETAGIFLNMVYPYEEDKDIQKLIKKLIFRLKTIGIKVDEPGLTGEPVLKKIEERREHRGYISNYDAEDTRLVCAAFEIKKNNFIFVNAVTHLTDGFLELKTAYLDRHNLEAILNEYRHGISKTIVFVEISAKYASYIMNETSTQSAKYIEELKQLKIFASNLKGDIQKPEDLYALPMPDKIEALSLEKILSHGIFELFTLKWDGMDDDKKEFNGIGTSTIVLPPYMVEEKKQTFLKTLIEHERLKSKIPLIRRMMEDYVYIFHCLKEFGAYRGLIETLKDPDALIRILLHFVKKSFENTGQQQPGLIVNPYGQVRP